jgi:NodT family efflux transporter outer membrane factor (OMF) lipoprotein
MLRSALLRVRTDAATVAPMGALPLAASRGVSTLALSLALPFVATLASCSWIANGFMVGPDYEQPAAAVANDWIDYQTPELQRTEADLREWWTVFHDPLLDRLIAEARAQNLDLKASMARVAAAAAQLGIARGEIFPQTQEIAGAAVRTKQSTAGTATPVIDEWSSNLTLRAQFGWELDLWGRFRRSIEAAEADLQATQADHDDATVVLLAQVATNYLLYRTYQERLVAAQRNVDVQQANYELTVLRRDAGAVTTRDVEMARQVLEQTRASLPLLELGRRQASNALCVLRGLPPVDLASELGATGAIPAPPARVAVGAPAELLRRRPDIRAVERRLASQSARIGVAESDFYPHLSLIGGLGVEAGQTSDLFDTPASLIGFIGPSFHWDVLHYGRFENNVEAQRQGFEQLTHLYRNAVLQASREAEDAIAAYLNAQRRAAALQQSRDAADRALQITLDQYREGTVDFTAVFLFQGTLAEQDDALADARGAIVLSLVDLYRSLGGGWQLPATPPAE